MRKLLSVAILVVMLVAAFSAAAAPDKQLAGCTTTDDEYGFRFKALYLNGVSLEVAVIGVDDFDPAITILNADGEVLICGDDDEVAAGYSVNLPSVMAGPSELSALASTRVPGDVRTDIEVIITSSDGTSGGEFVALVNGPSVYPAADEDEYEIITNEHMNKTPLNIYGMNLGLPMNPLNPAIEFSSEEGLQQKCAASSSSTLCDGSNIDLGGVDDEGNPYYIILDPDEDPIELTGNDVMLLNQVGNQAATFTLTLSSSAENSTGPYYFAIHSAVPAAEEESEEGDG